MPAPHPDGAAAKLLLDKPNLEEPIPCPAKIGGNDTVPVVHVDAGILNPGVLNPGVQNHEIEHAGVPGPVGGGEEDLSEGELEEDKSEFDVYVDEGVTYKWDKETNILYDIDDGSRMGELKYDSDDEPYPVFDGAEDSDEDSDEDTDDLTDEDSD